MKLLLTYPKLDLISERTNNTRTRLSDCPTPRVRAPQRDYVCLSSLANITEKHLLLTLYLVADSIFDSALSDGPASAFDLVW